MAIDIKHPFVSAKADSLDSTKVKASNWNAAHVIEMAENTVLGRGAGSGQAPAEELPAGAVGLAVLASALAPAAVAMVTGLVNGLLPGGAADGDQSYSGWQSASRWAPSMLTRLSERSAAENNELPPVASLEPSA